MAETTFRAITKLELGQGAQVTVANAAFDNLSRGISGYVAVSVTSADVTLTDADENDQAKHIFLDLTGVSTGARNVIVPTTPRVYIVRNTTTGGFAHTVKPVAGTGIAVSAGMITLLACDGTNVIQVGGSGTYTDEMAQDSVGAMLDASLTYVDATPLLQRAALTGDVTATAGSNATTIAPDVVTYPKMQNVSAASRVLGRGSAAGAGDVQEMTATTPLAISGTALTVDAATASAAGVVELATAGETTTGTDATRAVTPDGLAGSIFGTAVVSVLIGDPLGSQVTTGDGKAYFRVPSTLNGMNLVGVAASVSTVSTSGLPTYQLRRVRGGSPADMLSTKVSIDANEVDSSTAATAAVIDAANDDLATADKIFFDKDVAGTGELGDAIEMQFLLP